MKTQIQAASSAKRTNQIISASSLCQYAAFDLPTELEIVRLLF